MIKIKSKYDTNKECCKVNIKYKKACDFEAIQAVAMIMHINKLETDDYNEKLFMQEVKDTIKRMEESDKNE